MNTIPRSVLVQIGLQTAIAGVVGVSPVGAGYRLHLPDGTGRAATAAEITAANAYADAQLATASKDDSDLSAARAYTKLTNLMSMTPAQVQTWVDANVTNLAQAQDAIKTLAIAVSFLMRKAQ